MDDSVDKFLEQTRAQGAFDSEGSFRLSLLSARSKLAEFGQSDMNLWTLQFAQAFYDLGFRLVEVTRSSQGWVFLLGEPLEDIGDFGACLEKTELNFHSDGGPEHKLILGLAGISSWPIVRASWQSGSEIHELFKASGQKGCSINSSQVSFSIDFEAGKTPPFPTRLWAERLAFSPLKVYFKQAFLNQWGSRSPLSAKLSWKTPILMEYIHPADNNMGLRASSLCSPRVVCEQGDTFSKTSAFRPDAGLSWVDHEGTQDKDSIVILARQGLRGKTLFHAVRSGCLMQPSEETGFPDGFDIIYSHDRAKTDLGQLSLLKIPECSQRRAELVPALGKVLSTLEYLVKSTETALRRGKTPLTADLFPGFLGLLGLACFAGSMTSPPMVFIAAFFSAPSSFYFWYSRRQRGMEFEKERISVSSIIKARRETLDIWLEKLGNETV